MERTIANALCGAVIDQFLLDGTAGIAFREYAPAKDGDREECFLWSYFAASGMLYHMVKLDEARWKPLFARVVEGFAYYRTDPDGMEEGSIKYHSERGKEPGGGHGDCFFDDNIWVARNFLFAYEVFGREEYLREAQRIVRYIYSGWNEELGGLVWNENGLTEKGTAQELERGLSANACCIIVNARLYQLTGEESYLDWAHRFYDFCKQVQDPATGVYYNGVHTLIVDHVRKAGQVNKALYGYNSGSMILADLLLYDITGEEDYLSDAFRAAGASHVAFLQKGGPEGVEYYRDFIWFEAILAEGYAALAQRDMGKVLPYLRTLENSLYYALEHFLREDGLLPFDYAAGWGGKGDQERLLLTHSGTAEIACLLCLSEEGAMPRKEHPRPQMRRESWMNLNGVWDFAFDFGNSGIDRKMFLEKRLKEKILVPFCPESDLSGIGYKDFIPAVWYRRSFELTEEQSKGRILLHFGAVDYECRVWVNGKEAGAHKGGYVSFQFDITALVGPGKNDVTVYAADDQRSGRQCKGKQSGLFHSFGCEYTRTTGIWQTVWLEFVPEDYIENVQFYPNVAEAALTVKARVRGSGVLHGEAYYEGTLCGSGEVKITSGNGCLQIPLSSLHLWEAGEGRLYDLKLSFGEDRVSSYFGMREISIEGEKVLLNGKAVFQRLVLDQGFYPDGIYTAPSDEALVRDIELSLNVGFNGARLHQKVFEERFLYHCDRLGYLVWGEQGNWGLDLSRPDGLKCFLPEWMEVLHRDFNHPAIVGWCPFNETWDYDGRKQDDDLLRIVYLMTKQYDTTRPCIDTSGNFHVMTDIYDLHDYEQNPVVFAERYRGFAQGGPLPDTHPHRQRPVDGVPVFISEYGGIKWDVGKDRKDAWGYGDGPKTMEEYLERYRGLTEALLNHPRMFGFCFTQLYDVEQEVNGLYTYDRKAKFDMEVIRKINSRKAAIESDE